MSAPSGLERFWSLSESDLLDRLASSRTGLTAAEAANRLEAIGPNVLGERRRSDVPALLLRQFTSPIVLILIVAAVLSFSLRDVADGAIILGIVLISGLLGFWQERGAATAVEKLLAEVALKVRVVRDGLEKELPVEQIVPGDVVLLTAGSGIPADCRLLEEQDLFVNEAALTGESYPQDKSPGVVPAEAPPAARDCALFLGTHVVSGSGRAVVVLTGRSTQFGAIAERLRVRPQETEFETGVRKFGYLLMQLTLLMVVAIFAFNVYLRRPVLESFLFSLALAVGLTPQLLPAIISVNLARGARRMADHQVIVKRLAAIENFGSMNVLCSDKTGTLTQGRVRVHAGLDAQGNDSDTVKLHAFVNASFETAFANPIDEAIRSDLARPLDGWMKLDEVPYDFERKRLSVLADHGGEVVLVTKGALANVLDVCTTALGSDGSVLSMAVARPQAESAFASLSASGFRTLGVAIKTMATSIPIDRHSESEMTFLGMLALADPPKEGIDSTIRGLESLGVGLKMITGDNALVAGHVASQVGLREPRVLTGAELQRLSDDALPARAQATDVFAEIEPNQKERIIRALRKAGNVVGYMGDGINDAPALHAADVGISVQEAVDVAKDAADIVLLERDMAVLMEGVREGRATFANTLKYVFMATSANFGNMFSMAGASLLLPFLPLLPKQVLLTNLLTDAPELTIATDRVDSDWLERPHRWNIAFIRRFMLTFGFVSSVFDYLTFGVLIGLLHAGPSEFRTGWFVESVVSATLIVLVVRTRGPMVASRPSRPLLAATVCVALGTAALPFTPLGSLFGLVPLSWDFLLLMGGIVVGYVASAELAKRWFYRRSGR
ncbi:MAG: magnesium-translocating P-type ATPase [Fimbriimonadaceae bacterium]|nr:magnesium-translocating P-type ATPase [Fimbriimonadaceae bacterium]